MELHIETCQAGDHQICSLVWAGNKWTLSHSKTHFQQIMKELIEAERLNLEPKPASLLWTSTCDDDEHRAVQIAVREEVPDSRIHLQSSWWDSECTQSTVERREDQQEQRCIAEKKMQKNGRASLRAILDTIEGWETKGCEAFVLIQKEG